MTALITCLNERQIVGKQEYPLRIAVDESELSDRQREELERIEGCFYAEFSDLDSAIFDPHVRSTCIETCALSCNLSERSIRRHFYLYLWGGMTRFALVGPVEAKISPQQSGQMRRGRAGKGPALADVREQLIDGATQFFLPGKHTRIEAYVLTMKKHFRKDDARTIAASVDLDEILVLPEERPNIRQFRYVCDVLRGAGLIRPQRPGQARPSEKEEPQTGRSRDGVMGPGYRFEIDATRFQVQLVSRFSRNRLIGDATVYIIIDVWSGAIVGYIVSSLPASWQVAQQALFNCFTDKSEVFKELDLPYQSDDWPCHHIPTRLAADRGELVSNKAGVVPELGVKLEIMASGCPERKGTVESEFSRLKHGNHFYRLPGKHPKNPGRCDDDGKGSAAFTIHELEKRIVEIIIDLNNDPVPLKYIPPELLDAGWKEVTHIGLYRWGLDHEPGHTRELTPEAVLTGLMQKEETTATSLGINFKKQNFRSDRLRELGYRQSSSPITIWHSEFCDRVWFRDDIQGKLIPAENDDERLRRGKETFATVEAFKYEAEAARMRAKMENIHKQSEKAKRLNAEASVAEKEAKASRRILSKSEVRREIRGNTAVERAAQQFQQSAKDTRILAASTGDETPQTPPVLPEAVSQDGAGPAPTKSIAATSRERWFSQ
jgi:hypothetical protein